MNKEKIVKILIPVVALIVVIESAVIISGLNKSETTQQLPSTTTEEVTPTVTAEVEESPVADYVFATDTKEMKVGKSYKVTLNLVGKDDFAVDAVETYVKFDPELATVSKLTAGPSLPEDKRVLKVDNTSGLISVLFLTDAKTGFQVKSGSQKPVISFVVTPKEEGSLEFSLVTSSQGEKLVTVLPETSTGKSLAFTSSQLDINVTK